MYHFTADHPPEPVRLSFRALIPGHVRQYLKDFQLEAIRFMHNILAKGEFCIYNDESGLGKQASVVVLLDAACSTRKCLIVVQNDDRYVSGWEFHFNVLTNTNIAVIKDGKDSTDSPHSIYIAKWSTLRTIDDLSKFKFDFIILDNRGQMLNNSFCTSMLLKHYERNISILISSVDITSDLKLLHNVLRLGGRLEPQYFNFKLFEEKFKLPDAKELAYKRVDLEEYFCKRERLADYCKNFRLRRYCHQYETQLPLVKEDRYKINLDLWREKQNATNSESSSVEFVNRKNNQEDQIKDTQELFEDYCRQRRKQHLQFQKEEEQRLQQREQAMLRSLEAEKQPIYNIDDEVASISDSPPLVIEMPLQPNRENSDEAVLMSPLMVESDSDVDDIPEICNPYNDIEIVDLSSEEQILDNDNTEVNGTNGCRQQIKESCKRSPNNESGFKRKPKRTELDKLEEDIVDKLKLKELHKRISRHKKSADIVESKNKKPNDRLEEKRIKDTFPNEKTPTSLKSTTDARVNIKNQHDSKEKTLTVKMNAEKCKENMKYSSKTTIKEGTTTPKNQKCSSDKDTTAIQVPLSSSKSVQKEKNTIKSHMPANEMGNPTSLTPRKTRSALVGVKNIPNETIRKTNGNHMQVKQEFSEETNKAKKSISKDESTKVYSEKVRLKRVQEIAPPGVHLKQTRSMQRITRSTGSSNKYLTKNLSLQIDKVIKKKISVKNTPKPTIGFNNGKDLKEIDKNTQASIISHRSSQDYESLQCAQRLSDAGVFDQGIEKTTEFLVPPRPNDALGRNSLLPSSLTSSTGFLTESDVIFIQPSKSILPASKRRDQVVLLSSSDNENSTSQSSSTNVPMTSRRTRALKPRRTQQQPAAESSKVSSFSDLLAQQNTRSSAKSPDLFSNCSDLIQLPCTQTNLDNEEPKTPFEGFKIFGSEVKQMQQHYAFNKNINKQDVNLKKSFREQRSCLDILEKMFEPSNKKSKSPQIEKSSISNKNSHHNEATKNKPKVNTQIVPSHPVDAIAEACQQQEMQKRKRSVTISNTGLLNDDDIFEITNNGTFGSVMRLHSNGDISPVQTAQKANSKQHNKITNYLIGNTIINGSQEEPAPNSSNSTGNIYTEAGTPSKRNQQLPTIQSNNMKKSPKSKCNTTQATKLTKWFTKPSELSGPVCTAKPKSSNLKKTAARQVLANPAVDPSLKTASAPSSPSAAGKRIIKRRRLDLSFSK